MQKILVVDDAEVNRELLKSILENEYIVETAVNGKQALQKLQDYHSDTAAVLLDLQMPIIPYHKKLSKTSKKSPTAEVSKLVSRQWRSVWTVCALGHNA